MEQREIIFRAFQHGQICEIESNHQVTLCYNDISGWNIAKEPMSKNEVWLMGESSPHKSEFILMQKVGMKDTKGIDIYEGDVVKCGYAIFKVIYHLGSFMLASLTDTEADMEFVFSRKGRYIRSGDECLEIIGNVYEHNVDILISEHFR